MEEKLITIAWKDLSVYVPIKKSKLVLDYRERRHRFECVVQNVTGVSYPGEVIAIMGSPITANSTFLQVLAAKASSEVSVTGEIVVNGMEIQDKMNTISGYVEKQEVFFENITIKEHLLCQARLRMDRRLCDYERKRRVQQLLDDCDLVGYKDSPIIKIPKSLRIRLSLATELMTDPQILFCDEPNFGMDAAETQNLLQGLRDVANSGKTVICTFQNLPTLSLEAVDELVLLTDGQLAFAGSPRNAERFFDTLDYVCPKHFSIADFLLHTLAIHPGREQECKQQVREICISFNSSYAMQDLVNRVDLEIERDPSDILSLTRAIKCPWTILKTWWILHRYFMEYYRTGHQLYRILQIVVTGVLIGLCFYGAENHSQAGIQARKGFLFILLNERIFQTLLSSDASDLPIFLRENKAGLYGPASYVLAKTCFKLPIAAIETLLLVSSSYFLAGLTPAASIFLFTWLILFITSITSTAFVFALTTIWQSPNVIQASRAPVHVFLMVTTGMFVSLCSIIPGVSWIRFISWMFYAYESLAVLHFEKIRYIACGPNESLSSCYQTGKEVLHDNGLRPENFGTDLIILVSFYVTFNLIAYLSVLIRSFKS